ncbi:MAG TPA: DegQ family serine endoprotease [Patescibacteria group bacterium]|nr:DegQ family serine endoprotease [Patescibacteria group bacterium]
MFFRFACFAVFALTALLSPTAGAQNAQVPQTVQQIQLSFAPIVKRTSPAVVNIYTKRVVQERTMLNPFMNDPFFGGLRLGLEGPLRDRVESSLGSGVIVDPTGQVATNTHVIKGASEITVVTSDGREFPATVALNDEKTDLAMLRIDPKGAKLPWLEIGDSDELQVGDLVLAIGNPFGVGQTVTSGIVSALARTGMGKTAYGYFIQTDAAINPGNSGGALVDMRGRLIGINSMIFSRDGGSLGIGFAIPASMVKAVMFAASHGGKIVRAWTGIQAQPVTPDMIDHLGLPGAQGALVNRVNGNGPAARAGIRAGDVILAIDGRNIQDPEALRFRLATLPIGTPVKLGIWRDGKPDTVTMTTEAPPEKPAADRSKLTGRNPLAGATIANLSPAILEELGGAAQETGVIILEADSGNAARLGLTRGDIILSVNGDTIGNVQEVKDAMQARNTQRWAIQVLRGDRVMNLMITL